MKTYVRTADSFEGGIYYRAGTRVQWEPNERQKEPPAHYAELKEDGSMVGEGVPPADPDAPFVIPVSGVDDPIDPTPPTGQPRADPQD